MRKLSYPGLSDFDLLPNVQLAVTVLYLKCFLLFFINLDRMKSLLCVICEHSIINNNN